MRWKEVCSKQIPTQVSFELLHPGNPGNQSDQESRPIVVDTNRAASRKQKGMKIIPMARTNNHCWQSYVNV